MRVLLDEIVSRKLAQALTGHEVSTVPRQGWAGFTNGRLLDAIDALFDVFLTMDKGMRYQQRLADRSFGVIEVRAPSNDIDDVLPLVPRILKALSAIQPGEIITIAAPEIPDGEVEPPGSASRT
ncbi:MAG TPA: hypothetical protein VFE42_30600 [Chloroflexota bacterium]|nr:hypothetical protein [Chloroflexota bacterium]